MANWYGISRSNYVKFKNPATAVTTLEQIFNLRAVESNGCFALISEEFNGRTPSYYIGDDADIDQLFTTGLAGSLDLEQDQVDLLDVIHLFLEPEPDNVFVWVTVGAENARYLTGESVAIDHTGALLDHVSINDIYDDTNWSRAEY